MQSTHLTDEQFTDLLLGARPSTVQAHLNVCSQCSEEAARVSGAIGSFEHQTRLWAERRAASHAILTPQPIFEWLHHPRAWTAAALALAVAAGIGVSVRNNQLRPAPQAAVIAHQPVALQLSPATIQADNELLSAIDGELRADESVSASAYGLNVNSRSTRNRASKRISE